MSRRYDKQTTIFSPEGRLYQVEYALEAINNAYITIGILGKNCAVVAADKSRASKLLEKTSEAEKIFLIDSHILCAAAGWVADANILIKQARTAAQRWKYRFGEAQPVSALVREICDQKQTYTQFGGLRPYGVSFLFVGWDRYGGFQMYVTDPAGNSNAWKATAVGQNSTAAESLLKRDYRDDLTEEEAKMLGGKILCGTSDMASHTGDNIEIAILRRDETQGTISHTFLQKESIDNLMEQAQKETSAERDTEAGAA